MGKKLKGVYIRSIVSAEKTWLQQLLLFNKTISKIKIFTSFSWFSISTISRDRNIIY